MHVVSDGAVQAAGGEHSSVVVSSCVNAVDYNTDLLGSSSMAIYRVTNYILIRFQAYLYHRKEYTPGTVS